MSLDVLREQALGCTACPLSERRRNVVFGEGNPTSPLVLVGEGPGDQEDATGPAAPVLRQEVAIQQGIPIEKAREIVKKIKESKLKVQASIQGDLVRVSGKSRDLLQEVMQLLKQQDFGIDVQFTNYRTF